MKLNPLKKKVWISQDPVWTSQALQKEQLFGLYFQRVARFSLMRGSDHDIPVGQKLLNGDNTTQIILQVWGWELEVQHLQREICNFPSLKKVLLLNPLRNDLSCNQ